MRIVHKSLLMTAAAIACSLPAVAHAQAKGAVLAGTVVDSVKQPIANAEVSLPGLGITKTTDDKGAFRLTDIPTGNQRVSFRRIGFGQLDTVMVFVEGQTIERRVTLGRIVILDSVVVVDVKPSTDPLLADFEENRAKGFGRFVTRPQLDKMEGQTLGSVLQQLQGVGLIRGSGGQSWVMTKRGPASRCPTPRPGNTMAQARANQEATDNCLRSERVFYVPDDFESKQGVSRQCYARVYVDRTLMNPGNPATPFDANTFATMQLQAIQWYESSGGVPALFSAHDTRCGVLILHTRRQR
jgi:hypothetical protein